MNLQPIALSAVLVLVSPAVFAQPSALPLVAQSQADFVSIRFESVPEHYSLYVHTGASSSDLSLRAPTDVVSAADARHDATAYRFVCTAPCHANLPVGNYRFAVAASDEPIVDSGKLIKVSAPALFTAERQSYASLRYIGAAVVGVNLAIGAALIATSGRTELICSTGAGRCEQEDSRDWTKMALGAGAITTGLVVGSVFIFRQDRVHLSIAPLNTTSTTSSHGQAASLLPSGAELTGRF